MLRKPSKVPVHRRKEWFDDDAFWRDFYPYLFSQERFAEASGRAEAILKLARPRGRRVLDLCCGPGRFSLALARRGFQVTGVDRTKHLLDRARAKARTAGVTIEWVREDMRDFVRPGAFDLALSLFTSFGYFDDKRQDRWVLENLLGSLRPGGVCVMEMMGKEILARIARPTLSELLPDGSTLVQRCEIFDDWTRVRNEWILIRGGRTKTFRFHHTIYSGQELRERMEQAGFSGVRLYGDLQGAAYGPEAQRLIAVGRRPLPPGRPGRIHSALSVPRFR